MLKDKVNAVGISLWTYKKLSDEFIKRLSTSDNSLALCYGGNKARVTFNEGCLTKDKITFTHEKTVNI